MRTSQLINTKSLVRQCRERRANKAVTAAIRKVLILSAQIVYYTAYIKGIIKMSYDMMDWVFPSVKFSIKYMCKYVGTLQEQLLLPEGKPHLNNKFLSDADRKKILSYDPKKPHLNPNVVQVAVGVNFHSGKPIVQLIDKNGNREQI